MKSAGISDLPTFRQANDRPVAVIISSFISMNPDVKLQITQASEKDKVQQLRNGDIDSCITFPPMNQNGIEGRSFLTEESLLAVPHTHRLANQSRINLSDMAEDSFICINRDNPFRDMTNQFCQEAGFTPNVICEVDEHSAVGHYLRAGSGVAFLPETLIEKIETSFHVLHINKPICKRTYQISWQKDRYMSVAARRFKEFFIQSFNELQKKK
ncbi:LysR substrate-binding domain-containing protein [Bacillus norwichensis]|uniref:LysR substrate-binding domain-containing protein n=1 Tax=Bacillus norwichensis TaxID=2762217 RepID=A0ABR8VJT6_9BACI|nr:LysR substrate-binding domain-containing protein [Bacillus norwichensis]MBD8005019.1 hypothetical protein [Bacillus norwichensis]